MFIPLEEIKIDNAKIIAERKQGINSLIEAYDAIAEAEKDSGNVWNITNIADAQNGTVQPEEEMTTTQLTDAVQTISAMVLDMKKQLDGKGESL